MTDLQLQLALAKMLPDLLGTFPWDDMSSDMVVWEKTTQKVQDTEWLHVCWLVEKTLNPQQLCDFVKQLQRQVCDDADEPLNTDGLTLWDMLHASWQQRAQGLCKVKGIDI